MRHRGTIAFALGVALWFFLLGVTWGIAHASQNTTHRRHHHGHPVIVWHGVPPAPPALPVTPPTPPTTTPPTPPAWHRPPWCRRGVDYKHGSPCAEPTP